MKRIMVGLVAILWLIGCSHVATQPTPPTACELAAATVKAEEAEIAVDIQDPAFTQTLVYCREVDTPDHNKLVGVGIQQLQEEDGKRHEIGFFVGFGKGENGWEVSFANPQYDLILVQHDATQAAAKPKTH